MEQFSTRRTLCASIGSMWTVLRQSLSMDLMIILEQLSKEMVWMELLLLHPAAMLLPHHHLEHHHQEGTLHQHQLLLLLLQAMLLPHHHLEHHHQEGTLLLLQEDMHHLLQILLWQTTVH